VEVEFGLTMGNKSIHKIKNIDNFYYKIILIIMSTMNMIKN